LTAAVDVQGALEARWFGDRKAQFAMLGEQLTEPYDAAHRLDSTTTLSRLAALPTSLEILRAQLPQDVAPMAPRDELDVKIGGVRVISREAKLTEESSVSPSTM
jgi:hypothetical protein